MTPIELRDLHARLNKPKPPTLAEIAALADVAESIVFRAKHGKIVTTDNALAIKGALDKLEGETDGDR